MSTHFHLGHTRLHVVVNCRNRLPLLRVTLPRILQATQSDEELTVVHTIYDDNSSAETRDYLLTLKDTGQIENLLLGSGDLRHFLAFAQPQVDYVANFLQVLRACLFVAPAAWVLHFTDDCLTWFAEPHSNRWIKTWIRIMEAEPDLVSLQMTSRDSTIIGPPWSPLQQQPAIRLHPIRWISDRYNLYRCATLVDVFADVLRRGEFPDRFEERLNRLLRPNDAGMAFRAAICQWDSAYVGTHVGQVSQRIAFEDRLVERLVVALDRRRAALTFTERDEFFSRDLTDDL